jgi:hypothetical protein
MARAERHPATLTAEELLDHCDLRQLRRSGPGGQNRNKVATAIVLTHRPTGLIAEANETRTQATNRRVALYRLRLRLALEQRCLPNANSPSALWNSRCRNGRISINPRHEDFPAILAEALDFVVAARFDMVAAGEALGCTSSQLTKLLNQEPMAFLSVNVERTKLGLRRLQ